MRLYGERGRDPRRGARDRRGRRAAAGRLRGHRSTSRRRPRPATDDWPFLYLLEPYIAPYYLGALGIILAFAAFLVWRAPRAAGTSLRRFSPHFFLLGIAFLLLETRSLVTFSLLFGTTWLVNSLVVLRRPR